MNCTDSITKERGICKTPAKIAVNFVDNFPKQQTLPRTSQRFFTPPELYPTPENVPIIKARVAFYDELEYGDPKIARWHLQRLTEAVEQRDRLRQHRKQQRTLDIDHSPANRQGVR